jgi:hypothetical protein
MIQTNLFAQTEKKPDWVNMMDDPKANYFQTIDEFKDYWSTRMIPGEAHEDGTCEEEEKDNRSFLKKIFQSEEKALAKSLELVITNASSNGNVRCYHLYNPMEPFFLKKSVGKLSSHKIRMLNNFFTNRRE